MKKDSKLIGLFKISETVVFDADTFEELVEFDFHSFDVDIESGLIFKSTDEFEEVSNSEIQYRLNEYCQIAVEPICHYMLQTLLMKKKRDEALRWMTFYKNHQHIEHSLELLLYRVMEVEKNLELLPFVVNLIKGHDNYVDIVVRYARKTEVSIWKVLFQYAGDPVQLFNVRKEMYDEIGMYSS
jgi:hypothetical protein